MTAPRRRALRRRLPAAAGVIAFAVLLLSPVTVANAQATTLTVSPSAEAWYQPPPGLPAETSPCDLPTGCGPQAPVAVPSQYLAGTLHVGVRGGVEESRTYLTLDLAARAADQSLTGGTLTLPLAIGSGSGTLAPDTATLRACLVTDFVIDGIDGRPTGAPATDCATSSIATYVASAGDVPARFRVDLAPFAARWSALGSASLALVPGDGSAPSDVWHVAFSRRDRADVGAEERITAQLQLARRGDPEPALRATNPIPNTITNTNTAPTVVVPIDASASFAVPPLPAPDLLALPSPEPAAMTHATAPIAAVVAGGRYAYPAVFLLPLLVGVAIAWTGRAFTRDLTSERA